MILKTYLSCLVTRTTLNSFNGNTPMYKALVSRVKRRTA